MGSATIFSFPKGHKEKHVGSVKHVFAHHYCQMKFKSFKEIDFENQKRDLQSSF